MHNNFCLPVRNKPAEEVISLIRHNLKRYTYFEVWIRTIRGRDALFVGRLLSILGKRLIIVMRNASSCPGNSGECLKLVHQIGTRCFVDLDIHGESEILNRIRQEDVRLSLICSFHDFTRTGNREELSELVCRMKKYNPDIIKIATQCRSYGDAIRLLELKNNLNEEGLKNIVLGMGTFGRITRVWQSLDGILNYVPLHRSEETAPGQIAHTQMTQLLKLLKN